jgi:hypothetical protein
MKKKFGADSYIKCNNNNYKKVSLLNNNESNSNISSNKSFNINAKNRSFDYNIVNTINNTSNKSNITNYLNTINSHNNYYERKVKSKNISNHIYTNCLINKTFSNNNNTSLNIIENKKINTYAGSNGKNTFFNKLNEYQSNFKKEKEKEKSNNFLFTQNNINNFYILNTYDNKEKIFNNYSGSKKYHNYKTNLYIKKNNRHNNLLYDLFQKENDVNDEFSNNVTLNAGNNFKNKKSNSIFCYKTKNKIKSFYNFNNVKEINFNNIFLKISKNKINNENNKQSYISKLRKFNINNNEEDSIDIDNIDNSSILVDNEK